MNALLSHLKRQAFNAHIWQATTVLSLAAIPISNHFVQETAMQRTRLVAFDSRNTAYISNLGTFEDVKAIHTETAKMALETMFNRSPEGFDNAERLERLFSTTTSDQIKANAAKDAETFRLQNVHQKVETGQINEMGVDNDTALVSVEGQVLRTSVLNSKVVSDTKKVTVFMRITLNDNISNNGKYPLVVTNCETRFLQ